MSTGCTAGQTLYRMRLAAERAGRLAEWLQLAADYQNALATDSHSAIEKARVAILVARIGAGHAVIRELTEGRSP